MKNIMIACLSLMVCLSTSTAFACHNDYDCTYPDKCYRPPLKYDGVCMDRKTYRDLEEQKEQLERFKKQQDEEIRNRKNSMSGVTGGDT